MIGTRFGGPTRRGMLRVGATLSAGAAGGGLLSACGGAGSPEATQQSSEPVTLSWMTDWTGGARGEATKLSQPQFEAENPKIKLDLRAMPGDYYDKLSTELAGGTIADVVIFTGNLFQLWAERGTFADISPQLKKEKYDKESVFWQAQYVESKAKVHAIPYQLAVSTWVYNKSAFRKANADFPTDAWTTDDFLNAARKLARPDENMWGIQMPGDPAFAWPWLYANDTDLTPYTEKIRTTIDSPKNLEVWQYAVDLIQRHRVSPIASGPNAAKGVAFTSGNLAMAVNNGPKGLLASIKDQFEWELMPTPRWAGTKKRVTNWNQQPHAITKEAEKRGHADAAVRFAIWMGGEPGQTIVAKTGANMPVHKKTAAGTVYLDGSVPTLKMSLDLLTKKPDQDARGFRIFRDFLPWFSAVLPILQSGFAGDIAVRDMAIKATAAGNAALDAAGS